MPRLPLAVQARGCAARPRPSDGAVQRPRAGQAGRRLARRPRAWPTSSDRAKVLAAQLANEKGGPIALQADSGGAFQVKAAVDQTLTGFGRLDTLVVNPVSHAWRGSIITIGSNVAVRVGFLASTR
jgi:hypothetical protein